MHEMNASGQRGLADCDGSISGVVNSEFEVGEKFLRKITIAPFQFSVMNGRTVCFMAGSLMQTPDSLISSRRVVSDK